MTVTTGQLLAQRYLLGRRIAVGGMGEVWEAEDTRLDRQVAVKVLRPELSGDPEFRNRFHTEARMAASLNHPGIAAVHDYGETSPVGSTPHNTAYLVMELVAGEPLAGILQRHPRLATDRTLDILRQAAEALQAAHERGLVHRDIKPGNILLTPTGQVKLTDFGVAKAMNTMPVTRQGIVMGTAHYIAPEQAAGDQAGPASDVYALGVVGYECLAGRRPFLANSALTVAMMHIRDAPPTLPPDVPPAVRALIETAMTKDPQWRYSTGGEFAAAIAAVGTGRPPPPPAQLTRTAAYTGSLLRPGRANPRRSPARRRSRVGIAVVILAALGLVLGGIGIREALLRSNAATPRAEPPGGPMVTSPFGEQPTPAPDTDDEPTARPPTQDGPESVFVIVTDYLLRSGSDAASIATERGLEPLVVDADGDEIDSEEQEKCLVTRVDPVAGWMPAGSLIELTCEEVS